VDTGASDAQLFEEGKRASGVVASNPLADVAQIAPRAFGQDYPHQRCAAAKRLK
jgi:hypothetical protein